MPKQTVKKSPHGIALGSLVKDTVTGFEGIAVARTEFAFGCIHIRIQAQRLTEAGHPTPALSFDDQRIVALAPPVRQWPLTPSVEVQPGDVVRDVITGAIGTITGRTVHLDGGVSVIIEQDGLTRDGDAKVPFAVTTARVELVRRGKLRASKASVATSGGPMARVIVSN